MKVLVCGGRQYGDAHKVDRVLAELLLDRYQPTAKKQAHVIIEGGAPGADHLARKWAERYGIHCATVKARWANYNAAAGPLRNAVMLSLGPDLVVAFPGGVGTANMVRQAEAAGVEVMRVQSDIGGI